MSGMDKKTFKDANGNMGGIGAIVRVNETMEVGTVEDIQAHGRNGITLDLKFTQVKAKKATILNVK